MTALSVAPTESVVALPGLHLTEAGVVASGTSANASGLVKIPVTLPLGDALASSSLLQLGLLKDRHDLQSHQQIRSKLRQNSSFGDGIGSIPSDGIGSIPSVLVRKLWDIGRLMHDHLLFTEFIVILMSLLLPTTIKAFVAGRSWYLRFFRPRGDVHMLICSIDYKRTKYPLSCTSDADHMRRLQAACNSPSCSHVLIDSQCTKANVVEKIKSIGWSCGPDDSFVFYFAGHGMSVPDANKDESDSKEEGLVCYFEGCVKRDALLFDDELSELLTTNFNKRTNIFILADCYHSGVICNFTKPCWKGRQAVSIVSSGERPTSGGIGHGGSLTNSILLATGRLQQRTLDYYSVDDLYREFLFGQQDEEMKSMCGDVRDIALDHPEGISLKTLPWPLIPKDMDVSRMSAPKQANNTKPSKTSSSNTDIWKAASQTEAEGEPVSTESLKLCAS
eukprot:TRINITY_DN3512_c0_g2_i1.p1 TRINITY_DN3512_c0_g2~~TRINITY_DN3512_c0_g2_i1.p1  ORF type:complete len:474 (+),score=75.35 TRINITY_DN3512_c0_g2_i1:80-1423(+)